MNKAETMALAGRIAASEVPIFEVREGEKLYRIFANGLTEGWGSPTVLNRIPEALSMARMAGITAAMENLPLDTSRKSLQG